MVFVLLCAFIIFYCQNLISCVCCLITANGQFSLGWVGPTLWTPPHRWRHRENATLLFESWTTANLSTLCTPEHLIIEQAAKGGTLLWLHGSMQGLISRKEISWSFWLQILFSPSGLPFLHWSSEASKPTTRFWEYLQYRRNCPWGDLTWLMFSECRLSSSAHNRAVLKIRNHDTGFVKLLRSFVFISLITSSTILHVTIVTPRCY